jgi:hypothetical protein
MFGFDDRDKFESPFPFRTGEAWEQPEYGKPRAWGLHPRFNRLNAWPKGYGPMPDPVVHAVHPAVVPPGVSAAPLADVFFVHPTTHRGIGEEWNAAWDNEVAQAIADGWPLQHQASAFRGCGRVFAPRYRQAHLRVFYQDGPDGEAALDLAYSDVRRAFEWYLEHEDRGLPLILAGHSQGSYHLIRLMRERFDGPEHAALAQRLVAAYVPGMQLDPSGFRTLKPLHEERAVGGYLTWMTVARGHYPEYYHEGFAKNPTVNPITWTGDLDEYSAYADHLGILNRTMQLRYTRTIRAIPKDGLLWIRPLRMPLGSLLGLRDWHIADYNLFWANIRHNAELRTRVWHERQAGG